MLVIWSLIWVSFIVVSSFSILKISKGLSSKLSASLFFSSVSFFCLRCTSRDKCFWAPQPATKIFRHKALKNVDEVQRFSASSRFRMPTSSSKRRYCDSLPAIYMSLFIEFSSVAESICSFCIIDKFVPILLHLSINSLFRMFVSSKLCAVHVRDARLTEEFR